MPAKEMIKNTDLSAMYIGIWAMLLFAFVIAASAVILVRTDSSPVAFGQTIGNETARGSAVGGSQGLNVTHGGGLGAGATNQST